MGVSAEDQLVVARARIAELEADVTRLRGYIGAACDFATRVRRNLPGKLRGGCVRCRVEWSIPADAWLETKTPRRVYVAADDGAATGFVSIGDMPVTSASDEAYAAGDGPEVTLSIPEARWLLAFLPAAIAEAEAQRRARDEED